MVWNITVIKGANIMSTYGRALNRAKKSFHAGLNHLHDGIVACEVDGQEMEDQIDVDMNDAEVTRLSELHFKLRQLLEKYEF